MATIIVGEFGVGVLGNDLDKPDAQDAREAELQETAERLLAKADRLRKTAQALLSKAEAAEEAAAACLPREERSREGVQEYVRLWGDPDPIVPLYINGHGYAFDPVELAFCGVKDFGDTDVLAQYIGSTADVTEWVNENARTELANLEKAMRAVA